MDGIGDCAGVLCAFVANGIDIAIGFAAAILSGKTVFSQSTLDAIEAILHTSLGTIEAVFHAAINSVEAVSQAIGNATKLSIYVLVVEAFE